VDTVDDMVKKFKQWTISPNGPAGQILPKPVFAGPADRNYSLKCEDGPQTFLYWKEQTFGFNIEWTERPDAATEQKVRRWFFHKQGSGPVGYGDLIALGYGESPSFVRYENRTFGINLQWVDDPAFEWKILGGKIGEPVQTQNQVAIFNTKTIEASPDGEPLIYFDRTVGGDVGWPSSTTWWGNPEFRKAALEAIGFLVKMATA
jgi:hypothetical protein